MAHENQYRGPPWSSALAFLRCVASLARAARGARRAAHRHHPRPGRADADRDPRLLRRSRRRRPGRPRHRRRDLGRSRALRPVPAARSSAPSSRPSRSLRAQPRFADWREINAQALVTGAVAAAGATAGCASSSACGTSSPSSRSTGFAYHDHAGRTGAASPTSSPTRSTSGITGEDGYFDTRIVYVAETGPGERARQAPRHHGPGRRQPPLPDRRQQRWC